MSAVNSGIKELREAIAQAEDSLKLTGATTVVFIDEIHRYTKTQQDAMLPFVENGTIILMGATTENPSFQIIPGTPVPSADRAPQTTGPRAPENPDQTRRRLSGKVAKLGISHEAIGFIADYANGDARSALNLLETAFKCAPGQ